MDGYASSSGEFNLSKFVSQQVSMRYRKLVSLKFIREKGVDKPNRIMRREIALKIWNDMCKHSKVVVGLIVLEFYANLCGERDGTIFVQGN